MSRRIRIGDPFDDPAEMRPLATRVQRGKIETLLAQSLEKSACLFAGGGHPSERSSGWNFESTIADCGHQDLPILLGILRFSAGDEAFDSPPAKRLSRSLRTRITPLPAARSRATFRRPTGRRVVIPVCFSWVDTCRVTPFMVPFGRFNNGGYGRDGGMDAIHDYTQTKGIFIGVSGQTITDPFVMH